MHGSRTPISVEENVRVPMRDGVELAADIYRPVGEGPCPVLLSRTPYDKTNRASVRYDGGYQRAWTQAPSSPIRQACLNRSGPIAPAQRRTGGKALETCAAATLQRTGARPIYARFCFRSSRGPATIDR